MTAGTGQPHRKRRKSDPTFNTHIRKVIFRFNEESIKLVDSGLFFHQLQLSRKNK